MYSFVAGAGLTVEQRQRGVSVPEMLRLAAAEVVSRAPHLGTPPRIQCLELPEIGGGWATITPEPGLQPPLISQLCDAEHAVLSFGQVDARGDAAECLRDAFVIGGPGAVTDLGGVFSALIVERREKRLHVLTSVLGCRSLHYRFEAGALFLAPTDLGVVALSRCEVQADLGALATLLACGWQLGGGTGLQGVNECQPRERWSWAEGQLSLSRSRPLAPSARIDAGDTLAIARKVDEVVEELRVGVRHQLEYFDAQVISVPLTAGVDSRAVLALLLSLVDRKRLRTYTRGTASQDVRVAAHLSERLGIEHEVRPTEPPSLTGFDANARFLATLTNGLANAHAAVGPQFAVDYSSPVPLGAGGEVFRGFYYKYLWRRGAVQGVDGVADALMAAPLRQLGAHRHVDPSLDGEPRRRLLHALSALEELSTDSHDLVDLFYIFERMGRWGSTAWRPSLRPSFVPFGNHRAMALAFQLPAPIGEHKIISTIIARHTPRSVYWTPVNGASLLALEGPGHTRQAARELLRLGAKALREAQQRFAPARRAPKQVRLAYLKDHLRDAMQDTLKSSRSLARQLFTPAHIEGLFTDGKGHALDGFSLAGALFSLELWKQALDEASRSCVG